MSQSASANPWQAFELGLVTIEMISAFIVSAAEGDHLFDAVFVTDANGLPCIPGESIAGVLRHALAGSGDPMISEQCRSVFGFQDGRDGEASRVRISFAHVHDRKDTPVPFRGADRQDPVLAFLQAGVGRDHVRIGMHGAVDDRGKFDELIVPAGARFTFELCVSKESPHSLDDLLHLLARPETRFGAGTRHGLGRFKVVRVRAASFDLSKRDDLKRLSALPVSLDRACRSDGLTTRAIPTPARGSGWLHGTVSLRPIGTWMIGGGLPTGREPEHPHDNPWERLPLTEGRIVWAQQGGGWHGKVVSEKEAAFLVPGSAVKGALRHRTSFHARRLAGVYLDPGDPNAIDDSIPEVETYLFGAARHQDSARPGRVYISDAWVEGTVPQQPFHHVCLDRFTQGPMDHLLYDEIALGQCDLKLDISIHLDGDAPSRACHALEEALADLCEGRLPIGAGRGHGRFNGAIQWDGGKGLIEEASLCKA